MDKKTEFELKHIVADIKSVNRLNNELDSFGRLICGHLGTTDYVSKGNLSDALITARKLKEYGEFIERRIEKLL